MEKAIILWKLNLWKRIMDVALDASASPLLCFVDEVLREPIQ